MKRLVTAFTGGIILGYYLLGKVEVIALSRDLSFSFLSLLLVCQAVLTVIMFVLHRVRAKQAFALAATLFFLSLGMIALQLKYQSVVGSVPPDTPFLKGEIIETPQQKARSVAVKLKTSEGSLILGYLKPKVTEGQCEVFRKGDSIMLAPRYGLIPTEPILSNDDDAIIADYRKYLFLHGVSATCYAEEWEHVSGSSSLSSFQQLRQRIQDRMTSALVSQKSFIGDSTEIAIILAMTTGERGLLAKDLRMQYAKAGVSHVLALSGFHLSIIYLLLEIFLLASIGSLRWKAFVRPVIILCLWIFVLTAGMPPSLVRAAIMFTTLMVVRFVERPVKLLDVLFFTAFVMLCFNPFMLLDVGFQLSFLSMLGLLTMGHFLYGRFRMAGHPSFLQKIWNGVVGCITTTVVCTLFTLPFVASYFGQIPLLSIFSNLIIGVLAIVLMFLVAAWWMTIWFTPLNQMTGILLLSVATAMNGVTGWFSSFTWSVLQWNPNWVGVLLWYLLLYVLCQLTLRLTTRPVPYEL